MALGLAALAAAAPAHVPPAQIDPAVYTDPPHDKAHPAGMEVLHIPSGGVSLNGVAYTAAGPGPHPVLVLMHGLPGNEKNLDLAQAVRRAGWTVVTFNYRGSWGSPGRFSFAGNLADARAVLAFLRDPAEAAKLGIDPKRLVVAGHSMGGWVAAMTAERDPSLAGAILISAANMGGRTGPRAETVALMADNMESLAGVTAQGMADEVIAHAAAFDWTAAAARLAGKPLLVLTSDDGLAPEAGALAARVKAEPGARVAVVHAATDHGWSGTRIRLEHEVISWLRTLP
ncbi:MAG: alpha/beta hydrolase [Alphaproteobacteria bacterium]|nr:alpha/beta hydrolase [Alphaproteobacteria bacterium]MBV9371907.1 alpha/beta hydrolase [Alphaproteobacteria bacterium]MBV9902293.1 alpha/beta hydrolase [Alphaproteobacteria bacterium]